jgi:hypothetical protein
MMHRFLLGSSSVWTLDISETMRQNIDMNVSSQGNIHAHLAEEATVEVASWQVESGASMFQEHADAAPR